MSRHFTDWLAAYVKYASVTEAPLRMHAWAGVGALAGALRRRVWIDMRRFTWTPSFYIIFVAPPGVVVKSTTIDIAMDLLRKVPGVKFGPNAATWQSLVTAFAGAAEAFEHPPRSGDWHPMSPITLVSSELGSLLNLQDREMIALLIELWDGKKSYEKLTKTSGHDLVDAPWINLEAATTPHWIAENMPASAVGGGLSSRCVFLYADEKEKFVPYVDEVVEKDDESYRQKLIQDLEHISVNLCGPYLITEAARVWGREWYTEFWKAAKSRMDDRMLEGYAARKQTHLHKLAMILSASRRDELVIGLEDLQAANVLLSDLEGDMHKVFSRIGRTEDSLQAERLISFVTRRGAVKYDEAYRLVHAAFPDFRDFEGVLTGAIRSGQLVLDPKQDGFYLKAIPTAPVLSPNVIDLPNADTPVKKTNN